MLAALLLGACTADDEEGGFTGDALAAALDEPAPDEVDLDAGDASDGPGARDGLERDAGDMSKKTTVRRAEKPIGARIAPRTSTVYFEPRFGSELRGRVDKNTPFSIYELVAGTGGARECDDGEGWARVEDQAYVCLHRYHEPTKEQPRTQPVVPEGLNVPFIYAKPKQDRHGTLDAEVPRYRNKWGLLRGREPADYLVGNRQYAFVEIKRSRSVGKYLVDPLERVVPMASMRLERPSEHFGRVLAEQPVAEGLVAGWIVRSDAEIRVKPHPERGKVVARPSYHSVLDTRPERERHHGEWWYLVPDAVAPGTDGYLLKKNLRRFLPAEPLEGVEDDERWIDIDLVEQVLSLYRGAEPEFITLISSGNGKHPTPRGVFRLRGKQAIGKMESKDDAQPDELYYVEAVPWVQYFYKRYALHTSYWHNRFGHRHSHGCVNLAPRDSIYVFSQTAPTLPPGWTSVNETDRDIGTSIRLRRRDDPLPDKRKPIGEPDDEDEDEDEAPEAARAGDDEDEDEDEDEDGE